MRLFTIEEIAELRALRDQRAHMAQICAWFPQHSREEIVEAIDATIRRQRNDNALIWVNRVLCAQATGRKLVNGRESGVRA